MIFDIMKRLINTIYMNKNLVIILALIILVGGGVIVWQLSGGEEESTSTSSSSESSVVDDGEASSDDSQSDVSEEDEIPSLPEGSDEQVLTDSVVAEYNTPDSCWTIVNGNVYDITEYIPRHPGGVANISQICGAEGTSLFEGVGAHQSGGAPAILDGFLIGPLEQ